MNIIKKAIFFLVLSTTLISTSYAQETNAVPKNNVPKKNHALKATLCFPFGTVGEYELGITDNQTLFVEYGSTPVTTEKSEGDSEEFGDINTMGFGVRHYFSERFYGPYVGLSYTSLEFEFREKDLITKLTGASQSLNWAGPMIELGFDLMFFDTVSSGLRLRAGYGQVSGDFPTTGPFEALETGSEWVPLASIDWKVIGINF